jgi:hypothetical protein
MRLLTALRIHALVRLARVLVFVGRLADTFSRWCRRAAGSILDELTAWADAQDAHRQEQSVRKAGNETGR